MISREAIQKQLKKAQHRLDVMPNWKKKMFQRIQEIEIALGIIPSIEHSTLVITEKTSP